MKKFFIMSFAFCSFFMISCTEDNRTINGGFPDCPICRGSGYTTKTEFFIFEKYYDCIICKTKLEKQGNGSNVSFEGRKYGECNYCDCHYYTPKSGTSECECNHSKHSHIGM